MTGKEKVEISREDLMRMRAQMLGLVDQIERALDKKPRTAKLRDFYRAWVNEKTDLQR